MGVARLLAKGWVACCLFLGAAALTHVLNAGMPLLQAIQQIGVTVLLFGAMGLLFVGGYGAAAGLGGLSRLRPTHWWPGFNEIVFSAFACASFVILAVVAPPQSTGGALGALEAAIHFVLPGQRALETALGHCGLDGGRIIASSFCWTLALVYLGSAVSRLRLAAGIVRLERKVRPEALGPTALALLLGMASVVGIQLFIMGSVFLFLPCAALAGLPGTLIVGLVPLMLAYLIVAALTNLLALGPEA